MNIPKITKSFSNLFQYIWQTKKWHNVGEFCDRKYHPFTATYRRYRRGKLRCRECGYKIGKRQLKRKSPSEILVDAVFNINPFLELMHKKVIIEEVKDERDTTKTDILHD